jgi:hypothetical protein
MVGIGVGVGAAFVCVIFAVALVYRRHRGRGSAFGIQRNEETWSRNNSRKLEELSVRPLQEITQLETREHAVELSAMPTYPFEIGTAI